MNKCAGPVYMWQMWGTLAVYTLFTISRQPGLILADILLDYGSTGIEAVR